MADSAPRRSRPCGEEEPSGGAEPERPYNPGRVEVTLKPRSGESRVIKAWFHYDPIKQDRVVWDEGGE